MQHSDSVDEVILDRYARLAMGEIFERGYRGPCAATSASAGARGRPPKPHTVIAFNLPLKCFPLNAQTFHDVFSGIAHHNPNLTVYTKLLGMLSLAVTRPRTGFGQQAKAGIDKRGEVPGSGETLLFEHEGRRYDRTVQCIEDLVSANGAVVGHRLWLFVLDPALNLGEAIKDVAHTNGVIYNPAPAAASRRGQGDRQAVAESDPYVHHSQVTCDADIYDLFSVYVRDGYNSFGAAQHQERGFYSSLERSLMSMTGGSARNAGNLVNKDSEHHPTAVLAPPAAFAFHATSVCDQQRDIENYFLLPADDDDDDDDADDADDDRELERQALAAVGALDDDDGGDIDDDDIDLADEELRAAQMQSAELGPDSGRVDQTNDDDDNNSVARRWRQGATFLEFPKPKLVQRIPIELFGRKLLNVPLRGVYAPTAEDRCEVDVETIGIEHVLENLGLSPDLLQPETPRSERRGVIRAAHANFVASRFERWSEVHFELDGDDDGAVDYASPEDCDRVLRLIYRAYLVHNERSALMANKRQLLAKLRRCSRLIYKQQRVALLGGSGGEAGEERAGLPVSLPELNTEEGITYSELRAFAEKDDILEMRIANHALYNEVITTYRYGTDEFNDAMRQYRKDATERFWDVFMSGSKVSPSVSAARAFFRQLQPEDHWVDHLLLTRDLSPFANLMHLYLSRYNDIYRGASTQNIFLLIWTVSINAFMYAFGLRPNVLLTGDGGSGKSFPMSAAMDLMVPGGFKTKSHMTDKSMLTNKPFRDHVLAMHEAARSFLEIDEKGFDSAGNPAFKDILTRNRASVLAYGQDESGARVAIDMEVLAMVNFIFATNDAVPSEEKALMQRFINVPVHYTKRVGFNKGDQSHASSNEKNGVLNSRHRKRSRVFSFYCLVAEKMIEAFIIPEPSADCANMYMREILNIYTRNTGIDTADARKRSMVKHLMRTGAVMNAVHTGLCTALSWNYRYDRTLGGVQVLRPFHPQMIVDHVMPRMYVTDDIAAFYLTMCAFMWEPRNQWFILDTVVSAMNDAPQKGHALTRKTCSFRMVKNENYYRQQQRKRTRNFDRLRQQRAAASSAAFGVLNGANNLDSGAVGGNDDDDDDDDDEPEFLVDTNYVVVSGSTSQLIYNKISQEAVGSRPAVNEIRRVMYRMSRAYRSVHPTFLVPADASPQAADRMGDDDDDDDDDEDAMDEDDELGGDPDLAEVYGHVGTIGTGQPPRSATARSQTRLYEEGTFRWVCDDEQEPLHEKLPVVRIESDPRKRKGGAVICVLVEALKDGSFQNGIKHAVREFMECDNLPREGRRVMTCYDYTRYENGQPVEQMPQYKEVLDLKYRDRPMHARHIEIGTLDSSAFLTSSIAFDPQDVNPAQLIASNTLATEFRDPPNVCFARRHQRACSLPPDDSWYNVLPETDAAHILHLQDAAIADGSVPNSIKYIEGYPHKQAEYEVRQREVRGMFERDPNNADFADMTISDEEYHRRAMLAELVNPLTYAHMDYASGAVVCDSSATDEQREALERIQECVRRSATSLAAVRAERGSQWRREVRLGSGTDHASPGIVHATQTAQSVVSYNTGFSERLAQLHRTLPAKAAQRPKRKSKKRAASASRAAAQPPPSKKKRKLAPKTTGRMDWSVAPSANATL